MTDTSTSSNNACTCTRHFRSEISPFRQASNVPSSMREGIGVLIVVTAAIRVSSGCFVISTIWAIRRKTQPAPRVTVKPRARHRLPPATSLNSKQRSQPFANLEEQRVRCPSGRRDRSFLPGDAPRLVCKHDARDACTFGQDGFERIAAHATGDRADHAKAGDSIVTPRRHDDGRSPAALFVSDRGVQIDPDDVPGLGTIVTRLRCQRPTPNRSRRDGWPA